MREFQVSVADAVQSDEDTSAICVDLGLASEFMSLEEARSLAAALIRAADSAALLLAQ